MILGTGKKKKKSGSASEKLLRKKIEEQICILFSIHDIFKGEIHI